MKKLFNAVILLGLLALIVTYQKEIITYIMNNYIYKREIVLYDVNQYMKETDYHYLDITNDFYPNNKSDVLNIFYTVINNGWDEFSFYCSKEYTNCLDDIKEVSNDDSILSTINNFVHPFNNYNQLLINYNNFGKVEVVVNKLYSDEEIEIINNKVDEIYTSLINDNMSTKDKILAIHDYIINTTSYDSERSTAIENNIDNFPYTYESHKAYGTLIQNKAICSGYSDAMAIFLNKMGIVNYKISSNNHVWNLVYLDQEWLHLDLTWDDPVVNTNENILLHNYFLITSSQLQNDANIQHDYSKEIYLEAK